MKSKLFKIPKCLLLAELILFVLVLVNCQKDKGDKKLIPAESLQIKPHQPDSTAHIIPKWPVENDVKIARQIWGVDSLTDLTDQVQLARFMAYLLSDEVPVARAAARKFAIIGNLSDTALLNNSNQDLYVQGTIGMVKAIMAGKTPVESAEMADAYFNNFRYGELLVPLHQDEERIFWAHGWYDLIQNEYSLITEYPKQLQAIQSLNEEGQTRYLVNKVLNFDKPAEYEAAINILILRNNYAAIPPVLKSIESNASQITTSPPPYNELQSRYRIALELIISLPDKSSLPSLEKLAQSKVTFVSDEAQNAIKWITSGVPYPYKYRDLFIFNPGRFR